MFLSIATTHQSPADLGYLLHKHPGRVPEIEQTFGKARVFYPEAGDGRCEAALVLDSSEAPGGAAQRSLREARTRASLQVTRITIEPGRDAANPLLLCFRRNLHWRPNDRHWRCLRPSYNS